MSTCGFGGHLAVNCSKTLGRQGPVPEAGIGPPLLLLLEDTSWGAGWAAAGPGCPTWSSCTFVPKSLNPAASHCSLAEGAAPAVQIPTRAPSPEGFSLWCHLRRSSSLPGEGEGFMLLLQEGKLRPAWQAEPWGPALVAPCDRGRGPRSFLSGTG